jgi:hypothetical protein
MVIFSEDANFAITRKWKWQSGSFNCTVKGKLKVFSYEIKRENYLL